MVYCNGRYSYTKKSVMCRIHSARVSIEQCRQCGECIPQSPKAIRRGCQPHWKKQSVAILKHLKRATAVDILNILKTELKRTDVPNINELSMFISINSKYKDDVVQPIKGRTARGLRIYYHDDEKHENILRKRKI